MRICVREYHGCLILLPGVNVYKLEFYLKPGIGTYILWPYILKVWTLEWVWMTLRNRPTKRQVNIWYIPLPQLPFPSTLENSLHSISLEFGLAALPSNSLQRKWSQIAWKEAASFIFPPTDTQLQSSPAGFQVTSCPVSREQFPPLECPSQGAACQSYCMACISSWTRKIHSSLHTEKQAPGTIKQSNPFPNSPSLPAVSLQLKRIPRDHYFLLASQENKCSLSPFSL